MRSNPWQLYQSLSGWEDCARRLDAALAGALAELDETVIYGATPAHAAPVAYKQVVRIMDYPINARYGAGDTEPRTHLWAAIRKHVEAKYPATTGVF